MRVIVSRTGKRILSMKLDEDGNLHVVANSRLRLNEIKKMVEDKRDWIAAQLAKKNFATEEETTTDANVGVTGSATNDVADIFCGRKTLLCGEVFCVKPSAENKCHVEGDSVFVPEKMFTTKENRIKAVKSCVKKYSVQSVSEAISRFGSCVSLCPTKIEFRNISRGWLKCSNPAERIVTLDYRISQLPEHLQHYLIVHAFSHFTNVGHDGNFWNTVCNYMPNYKNCVEELLEYNFLKEI